MISLFQNWAAKGEPPLLADVGPWYGSFDNVPPPSLPDGVVDTILRIDVGSPPGTEVSGTEIESQGTSQDSRTEIVPAAAESQTGGKRANESSDLEDGLFAAESRGEGKYSNEPNDWDEELFGDYVEDVDTNDG